MKDNTKGWIITNKNDEFLQLILSKPGWSGDGAGHRWSNNNAFIFANYRDAIEYIKRNFNDTENINICIVKFYQQSPILSIKYRKNL